MHPHFGPIRAYTILYLGAIVLHFVLAYFVARRLGLRGWWWRGVSLSYATGMTVGARVLFDLMHHTTIRPADLATVSYYAQGGLWGGPLVHLVLISALITAFGRRRGDVFDLTALTLPLPLAVAKIGCFLNGCCYGTATDLPWGIQFPTNPGGAPIGVALHPVQLYEVAVLVLTFVGLMRLSDERWRGTRLFWFLAAYGVGRTLVELMRGDAAVRVLIGPLTASQIVCLGVAVIAAGLLVCKPLWYRQPSPTATEPSGGEDELSR